MLRYVLDAHKDVFCPDEVEVGAVSFAALNLEQGLAPYRADGGAEQSIRIGLGPTTYARRIRRTLVNDGMLARIRGMVRGLFDDVLRTQGKRYWCDKSPRNCDYAWLLAEVFPDARFICLHRHCLDVVASCVSMMRFGAWHGMEEYLQAKPNPFSEAYALSWLEKTKTLLEFEAEHGGRCIRVVYEDFIQHPVERTADLLSFCGLDPDPGLTDRAFAISHPQRADRGDARVLYETQIDRARAKRPIDPTVGSHLSSLAIVAEVDETLRQLGLATVADRLRTSEEEAKRSSSAAEPKGFDPKAFVEEIVTRIGAFFVEPPSDWPTRGVLGIEFSDVDDGVWSIDFARQTLTRGAAVEATCTIRATSSVLHQVVTGELDPIEASFTSDLQIVGHDWEPVAGLLRALLKHGEAT